MPASLCVVLVCVDGRQAVGRITADGVLSNDKNISKYRNSESEQARMFNLGR
jgi:hypothetical protein